MAAGYHCARTLLIFFNMLFLLCGIAIVGVGIFVTVDFSQVPLGSLSSDKVLVQGGGIAVTVIGVITILEAALGLVGGCRESKCILTLFFSTMFIVFLVVIATAVIILVKQDWVQDVLKDEMNSEVTNNITTGVLDWSHNRYNCCGIVDKPHCDRDYPPFSVCFTNSTACVKGCFDPLWTNDFQPYLDIAVGVLFGLSVVCALGALIAIGLCCAIRRRDDQFAYHHHHHDHHNLNSDYGYMKD